jgi:lycopene beta-cyclase
MIRGIDFYNHCFEELSACNNIDVVYGDVGAIGNEDDRAFVVVEGKKVFADFLFNSIAQKFSEATTRRFLLLQHFKGWMIRANAAVFDPSIATLMDFNVHQQGGPSFFYVLPVSSTEALVEYTVFSKELLQDEQYRVAMEQYIAHHLKIDAYQVVHEENGVIPMTNRKFQRGEGRVVNTGAAGGAIKGSTGYAFRNIQQRSEVMVASLVNHGHPFNTVTGKNKFHFYDSVFLNVMDKHPLLGEKIFATMFSANEPRSVFRFLDNESSIAEDLRIMKSLFSFDFMRAGWEELIKKARH